MTIAYFDCFSGIAGDMVLGAFVDAGLPLSILKKRLGVLPIGEFRLTAAKKFHPVAGTDVKVFSEQKHAAALYTDIDSMLKSSELSKPVKELSRSIFETLAGAEAKIHGTTLKNVHLHEAGALDSIVDIVGAAIGFDHFEFDSVHSSPIPVSRGIIKCAHGILPSPGPATMEILKGAKLEPSRAIGETVTPTGAAIITTVAQHFGECPIQEIEKIGMGYGDKPSRERPNALRLLIGQGFPTVLIETDIDDMNPQFFENAMKKIMEAGAVEANLGAVQMKKNRPGIRITAIAPWDKKNAVIDAIMKETTTFGVRYWPIDRRMLTREFETKRTKSGKIIFKLGFDTNGKLAKVAPEYESILKLAKERGEPVAKIYMEAIRKWTGSPRRPPKADSSR